MKQDDIWLLPFRMGDLASQANRVEQGLDRRLFSFAVDQTLEQSGLGLAERHSVGSKIHEILRPETVASTLSRKEAQSVFSTLSGAGLLPEFGEQLQWFEREKGKRFIQEQLPGIQRTPLLARLPKSVQWQTLTERSQASSSIQGILDEMADNMAKSLGIDRSAVDLTYKSGQQGSFHIHGYGNQTSTVHTVSMGLNRGAGVTGALAHQQFAHEFQFFEPSANGFIAQASDSGTHGFSRGESIFVTPTSYVTDPRKGPEGYKAKHFHGERSYEQFQAEQIRQLNERTYEVNQQDLSGSRKHDKIRELRRVHKQAVLQTQGYVESAGVLGAASDGFGTGHLTQGTLTKAAAQRQSMVWIDSLSKYPAPMGDPDVYKLMDELGGKFQVSSGAAGNRRALYAPEGLGYRMGVASLMEPHAEPFKGVSDMVPAGAVDGNARIPGTSIPRYSSLYTNSSGSTVISNNGYRPTGVQAVSTFVNMEGYVERNLANPLIPDGTVVAHESLYKSGALDMAHSSHYKVTALGPGGKGPAQLGEMLRTLVAGGELRNPVTGEMVPFEAMGERKLFEAFQEQGLLDDFRGGIPLEKGQVLGVEAGTGRSVAAAASPHIEEAIVGLTRGSSEGEYLVQVARHVKSFQDANTGATVGNPARLIGEALTKEGGQSQKYEAAYETARGFEGIIQTLDESADLSRYRGAELIQTAAALEDPAIRTLHQAGSLRYSLGGVEKDMFFSGQAKQAQQAQARASLAHRVSNLTNNNLLMGIDSGEVLQMIEQDTKASIKLKDIQREVLGANSGRTMQQRLAVLSDVLTSGMNEPQKREVLANVFSPYSNYGDRHMTEAGQAARGKVFHSWNGTSSPGDLFVLDAEKSADVQRHMTRKQMTSHLGEVVSRDLVDGALGSQDPMRSVSSFGLRGYGTNFGSGVKGTVEPRFFDILRTRPELAPVMRDISSRMTDYGPSLRKLSQAITGPDSHYAASLPQETSRAYYKNRDMLGARDMMMDLGLNDDVAAQVQAEMRQGYKFQQQIYVPGQEGLSMMGKMVTGSQQERSKTLRGLYETYLNDLSFEEGATNRVKNVARATEAFQDGLMSHFETQVRGAPKGAAHGMMRGPIAGSVYALNRSYGHQLSGVLGLADLGRELDPSERSLRTAFQGALDRGESLGQQAFLSDQAAHRMFDQAETWAQDVAKNDSLLQQFKKQRTQYFSGPAGNTVMPIWRHPGIGGETFSYARVWRDTFSAESAHQDYVRVSEEFARLSEGISYGEQRVRKPNTLVGTAILQKLKGDHDGDHLVMALLGEEQAQEAIQNQLRKGSAQAHQHSLRYAAMDTMMRESLKYRGSQTAKTVGRDLGTIVAHAGPKQITPQISNPFTQLKYMVASSGEHLSSRSRGDLMRFMELAEQLTIHSKHLIGNVDYNLEMVRKIRGFSEGLLSDAVDKKKLVDDFMDIYTVDNQGKAVSQLEIAASEIRSGASADLAQSIQLTQVKADMVDVAHRFSENQEAQKLYEVYRRTTRSNMPINEQIQLFHSFDRQLQSVHGHAGGILRTDAVERIVAREGEASVQRQIIGSLNEGMTQAGKKAAKKLPTKGVLGMATVAAASMVAATAGTLALGPTGIERQTGGAHLNEEDLFPEEMEERNAFLHSGALPTPVTGQLVHPNYRANIHLPPGSYNVPGIGGRLGALAQSLGQGASSRIELNDHRSQLDALTLARIRNEII